MSRTYRLRRTYKAPNKSQYYVDAQVRGYRTYVKRIIYEYIVHTLFDFPCLIKTKNFKHEPDSHWHCIDLTQISRCEVYHLEEQLQYHFQSAVGHMYHHRNVQYWKNYKRKTWMKRNGNRELRRVCRTILSGFNNHFDQYKDHLPTLKEMFDVWSII